MNKDGSNPVQLTHRPSPDYWPAWTKDGKWIAFGSEGPEFLAMSGVIDSDSREAGYFPFVNTPI